MGRVVVTGLALALLTGVVARAQTPQQMVGSTPIKFPIPAGQCEITDGTPAEVSYKKRKFADGEKLYLMHADCSQLERFRKTGEVEHLTDYAQYAMPNAAIDEFYTPEIASRICAQARTEAVSKGMESDAQDANDKSASRIKFKEPKFLGVLLEEDNACYTGMLAPVTSAILRDSVRIGIFANVLINGKLIKYRALGHFRDSQGVTELLTKHKANVAAFIAANAR